MISPILWTLVPAVWLATNAAPLHSKALPSAKPVRHDADSAAIVKTVDAFHSALSKGDTAAAIRTLAADVMVLESGDVETRADYIAHHLGADIEFVRAIPSVRKVLRVTRRGDAAWVASTSASKGSFKGREINSIGAELIVLSRVRGVWTIRSIHWSSARRKQ